MAKITIFGLAGTGTSSCGKTLAQDLGYTPISTGLFFRARAASLGLDLYQFEALCSTDPSYDKAIDSDMEEYGKTHDNFVAESRLAWFFIPDSFKIKFMCDLDERIRRVAHRDKLSFEEAREKTLFRENLHTTRFAEYYGIKDYAPDRALDLIIDTTNSPQYKVLSAIKHAIGK